MTEWNQSTKTEFNSSVATLIRIDTALKMASQASIDDDFINWFKALGILKREAIVKMIGKHKDKRTECQKKFSALENQLKIFNNSSGDKSFLFTKVDNQLDEFEIFLRDFMDAKGMLMKDQDDDASRALK